MKIRKTVFNSLLILVICILALSFAPIINTTNVIDSTPETSMDYVDAPSIYIFEDDDSDLTSLTGDGTINNPYLIANYNFTNDQNGFCLRIQHTTKYILISNCYFDIQETAGIAISIQNSTNIAISSCTFTTDNASDCSQGISIWNCTNVDIGGNSITEFGSETGIWIMNNCSQINIHNNYIAHCWSAIEINSGAAEMHCYDLLIQENWIEFNFAAIYANRCHNLTIENNIINKAGTQYDQGPTHYIWIIDSTDYQTINNKIYYKFILGDIQYASHLRANESVILWFDTTYGRGPYTYQWDFGDGSANGSNQVVNHEYTQVGTYTVTVIVTDADGEIYIKSEEIYINIPCITECPDNGSEDDPEGAKIPGYSTPIFIVSGIISIIFLRKRFRAK